jgi:hypothetical protein
MRPNLAAVRIRTVQATKLQLRHRLEKYGIICFIKLEPTGGRICGVNSYLLYCKCCKQVTRDSDRLI